MAKTKISGAEITCDKIVKGLIDRLVCNEKRIGVLQKEL